MRSTVEDALNLLNKWKEEQAWLLVNGRSKGNEQHWFWARCLEASAAELVLAGEFVVMRLPLDSTEFEFADFSEAPEPTRSAYKHFESSLTMRSDRFLIAVLSTISGEPAPILPPDVIHPEDRS